MGQELMTRERKSSKVVDYIVLELATGGELFDFIANSGRFSEKIARTYFHQMIDALSYMHNAGYAHRDLKPENIMLDSTFNIKIADFGFAASLKGKDGSGQLHTQLGTCSYMAPEIHLGKHYSGSSVDLFASAIILFIMVTQRPPFSTANPKDPHYAYLAGKRSDLFWKAHKNAETAGEPEVFTKDFMDFFEQMVQLNPKHRLSASQILSHPWMKGAKATSAEIKREFLERK